MERFTRQPSPTTSGTTSPSLLLSLSPFSQVFEPKSRRSSGLLTTAPPSPVAERLRPDRQGLCSQLETDQDYRYHSVLYQNPSLGDGDGRCSAVQSANRVANSRQGYDNPTESPLLKTAMTEMEKTNQLMELLRNLSDAKQDTPTSPSLECTISDTDSDSELGLDHLIAEFCLPPTTLYKWFEILI